MLLLTRFAAAVTLLHNLNLAYTLDESLWVTDLPVSEQTNLKLAER
jgi:hypothetical protein